MNTRPTRLGLALSILLVTLSACATDRASPRNEVLVLGMIHSDHADSERYSLGRLAEWIRRIEPDVVLTEIPPDRLDAALEQHRNDGTITEPRVLRFPEYTDVVIPLQAELGYEIVPCAAWTREMADDRRAALAGLRASRPDDMRAVDEGWSAIETNVGELGPDDDPRVIHTDQYDALVRAGMQPYQQLGADLGPGGWAQINAAHYELIDNALDSHSGTAGRRVLITFGAWHKYWFLEQLRTRTDIELIDPLRFLPD